MEKDISYSTLLDPENGVIMPKRIGASDNWKWLRIDSKGRAAFTDLAKHDLVQRLAIPYRDLRVLDPTVPIPYPSAIFIREKALVLNLQSVKMIVAKDECYIHSVPHPGDANVCKFPTLDNPFVVDLCNHLAGRPASEASKLNLNADPHLPYELKALEQALSVVVRLFEVEVMRLDQEATPALNRLAQAVSRDELELIRTIKHRMTRLTHKVGEVRKELEDVLDDDADMADMYLARRAAMHDSAASTPPSSSSASSDALDAIAEAAAEEIGEGLESVSGSPGDGAGPGRAGEKSVHHKKLRRRASALSDGGAAVFGEAEEEGAGHKGRGRKQTLNIVDPHDIEDVEDLLESYFMRLDYLMSQLHTLKERIDDTEDLVNIDLDHKRNELVALDLVVTSVTLGFTFVAMVAGVFGMNLRSGIEESQTAFFTAIFVSVACAVAMFALVMLRVLKRRLMFLPSVQAYSPEPV